MELNQPDLLYGCINRIDSKTEKEISARFIARLGAPAHSLVVSELASLLLEQAKHGTVECIDVTPKNTTSLDSQLFTVTVGGQKRTYFFRIKDAAAASILPVVGVLFALLSTKYSTAVLQGGTAVKGLWSNLIRLEHDQDKDAVEVLTAISTIRASHFAAFPHDRIVGMEFPSTGEIASQLPTLSSEKVLAGVKRLESLRLIECKYWGDQAGDLTHMENRWGESL